MSSAGENDDFNVEGEEEGEGGGGDRWVQQRQQQMQQGQQGQQGRGSDASMRARVSEREQQLAASLAAAEDAQSQLRVVRDSTAAAAARQKGEADAAASAMAREMAVLRGELQVSDAAMAHTCTLTLLCRVHRM